MHPGGWPVSGSVPCTGDGGPGAAATVGRPPLLLLGPLCSRRVSFTSPAAWDSLSPCTRLTLLLPGSEGSEESQSCTFGDAGWLHAGAEDRLPGSSRLCSGSPLHKREPAGKMPEDGPPAALSAFLTLGAASSGSGGAHLLAGVRRPPPWGLPAHGFWGAALCWAPFWGNLRRV